MAIFKRKSKAENQAQPEEQAQLPKAPGCLYWVVGIGVILVVAVVLGMSMKKVGVNEVGVRLVKLGFGIWDTGASYGKPLPPGYHPILPYIHEFIIYKKNLQSFEFTSKAGGIRQPDYPSIEIRTSDGYKVKVDITLLYRVMEEKANLVRNFYKNDPEIKEKGIKAIAPGIIQNKLSELLHAEDFYNSQLRREKAELAQKELNEYFSTQGIEVVDIIIRDFEFPEEYESAILRKVLAEQLQEVQETFAKAALSEAKWKKTIAEANRDAQIVKAKGEADAKKIEAEGEKLKVQMIAEGDKNILLAESKGKGAIVQALSGPGGKVYVGLEYLKVLDGLNLMILQSGKDGVNPLEVEQMIKALQGR